MIEVDYYRCKLFHSKLVYFAQKLPPIKGYHCVYCNSSYAELPFRNPYNVQQRYTILLDLTQDEDTLFRQIKRQRRQFIRRGEKAGIQVAAIRPSDDILQEFQQLYNQIIAAKGIPAIPFWSLKILQPYLTVFKAMVDTRVIEYMVYLHDQKTARNNWVVRQTTNLSPDFYQGIGSYLQWESIRYFKNLGYEVLDLGGIVLEEDSPLYSITRYKRSYGGNISPTYWYHDVSHTIKPIVRGMEKVCNWLNKLKSNCCFPTRDKQLESI